MTATDEDLSWETEDDDATPPEDERESPVPSWEVIFGAPDYSSIIKVRKSGKAKDYEQRVLSMEKALLNGALRRSNLPDAALLLQHGPALAEALGAAADESEYVAHAIDIFTAPDTPWVPLVLSLTAVIGQFYRNHEPEFQQAADNAKQGWKQRRAARKQKIIDRKAGVIREDTGPRTVIKLPFGRKITLKWKLELPGLGTIFTGLSRTALPPERLVHNVFSDDALRVALKRQGYDFQMRRPGEQ